MLPLLFEMKQVSVAYGDRVVAKNINLALKEAEILGIVGESGSGKSTVLKAAMGLLGPGGVIQSGEIRYRGELLNKMSKEELRKIRGAKISIIFQDTKSSLCPIRKIKDQIYEMMSAHQMITKPQSYEQSLELFYKLRFEDGERILNSYPFELSGGMNQRVGIAMAMLLKPSLLLADEPTSALDVLAQKQVVEEMMELRGLYQAGMIVVTHNMGVVSHMADRIIVMQGGQIVEEGATKEVLYHPKHAYTKQLIAAVPKLKRGEADRKEEENGAVSRGPGRDKDISKRLPLISGSKESKLSYQ